MKAIVAVDKNWGIGKKNDLLFSLPEDMKFFREKTLNKVVIMGSNTLKSFPGGKPLKNIIAKIVAVNKNTTALYSNKSEKFFMFFCATRNSRSAQKFFFLFRFFATQRSLYGLHCFFLALRVR